MRLIRAARAAQWPTSFAAVTLAAALAAVGCATQSEQMRAGADLGAHEGLHSLAEQRRAQSVDRATQDAAVVLRSERPFLGTHSTARDVRAELPEVFRRDVTLRFAGRTNIATVAERVTEVTGLLVRVTPDVYQTSGNAASPASSAGVPGMPAPLSMTGPAASGALALAAASSDALNDIRMDFYGGRLDRFLDTVAARTGLYWEYRDNAIVISRLMTRMFRLNSPPGNQQFDASIGAKDRGRRRAAARNRRLPHRPRCAARRAIPSGSRWNKRARPAIAARRTSVSQGPPARSWSPTRAMRSIESSLHRS